MPKKLRLGVNVDHVATIRNARGGRHPDTVRAAKLAIAAGADGITAHLREDRRHIRDDDMARLDAVSRLPLIYPYWHQALTASERLGPVDLALLGPYLPLDTAWVSTTI